MEISKALYDEVKSCANIISGDEYKKLFCTIAKVVSDVVSQTLGPYGSTTIIDDGSGFTYPTKDGWSCMNRLRFNDPVYNTIFGIIKQVSFNSVSTVGDGTTTAMVATSAFLEYLYDNMIPNLEAQHLYNQSNIVYTMNQVTDEIAKKLRENSNVKHIDPDGDFSDINRIAYIATNGNYKFAKMIQEIYQKTKNPNIRIEIDNGAPETTYQIEKGYRFDCKPIAFNSYINDETGIIRKDDKPFKVIIFDHNVTYQMHKQLITSISQLASMRNTEYVILAPYFDDIVCSIIQNSAAQMIRQGSYPELALHYVNDEEDEDEETLDSSQASQSDEDLIMPEGQFQKYALSIFEKLLQGLEKKNEADENSMEDKEATDMEEGNISDPDPEVPFDDTPKSESIVTNDLVNKQTEESVLPGTITGTSEDSVTLKDYKNMTREECINEFNKNSGVMPNITSTTEPK